MTYANQHSYDNATEQELSDYRDSSEFADFCEYVALELLLGRDCQGIDAQIFTIDVELSGGGYQLAVEKLGEQLTEDQYLEWLNDTEDQFKEFLEC